MSSIVKNTKYSDPQLAELRNLAAQTAKQGGQLALKMRSEGKVDTDTASKSSLTDLVTLADQEVEKQIKQSIVIQRPDDTVLGEEAGTVTGSSDLTWVIDPIDGTVNYYYQYPGWVVSVAVESEIVSSQIAGAIYDPVSQNLYDAFYEGGARINEVSISVPTRPIPDTLDQALVATGFGYQAERRRNQAEALVTILPKVRDIRRGGAAAMDLCHLAMGRVDAYFEKGLKPWDYSAGILIARESGCTVEILNQTNGETFLLGARTQSLFDQLHELILQTNSIESD